MTSGMKVRSSLSWNGFMMYVMDADGVSAYVIPFRHCSIWLTSQKPWKLMVSPNRIFTMLSINVICVIFVT